MVKSGVKMVGYHFRLKRGNLFSARKFKGVNEGPNQFNMVGSSPIRVYGPWWPTEVLVGSRLAQWCPKRSKGSWRGLKDSSRDNMDLIVVQGGLS